MLDFWWWMFTFSVVKITYFTAGQLLTSPSRDQKMQSKNVISAAEKHNIHHPKNCNICHGFYDSIQTMAQTQT